MRSPKSQSVKAISDIIEKYRKTKVKQQFILEH